jgi:hypothetical protein
VTITANIIADSISPEGIRLTTFELEYPRFIHAELMTHRMFSRNAQSSRAVPVSKSLKLEYITPIVWGKNQAGMSSKEVLDEENQKACEYYWHALVRYCRDFAERMSAEGLHKQWANRCLEWFSPIKVVVTATEWDNFFWLRIDPEAAQPEIVELATKMKEAMDASQPSRLYPGMWHLPYVQTLLFPNGDVQYRVGDTENWVSLDVETAKKISASCCAQVSYRKLDTSIEKALEIYDKLFSGPKPHLSPVEHQCSPMEYSTNREDTEFPYGATHMDSNGRYWSANMRGWVQLRQTI